MTSPSPSEPVGERLANRLSSWRAGTQSSRAVRILRQFGRLDRAAYRAVAQMTTPVLDRPLRRVSDFANFSKPWFLVAAALALFGGSRGRLASVTGVAAIALTSFVVNQPMKLAGERRRPDRTELGVPESRWVSMPSSTSFPSGHSGSAAAFAIAVGDVLPGLRLPLRAAAGVVAFSRIYTGVHYPVDIVMGAVVGGLVGRATSTVARRLVSTDSEPVVAEVGQSAVALERDELDQRLPAPG
jgi:membrane-associated phospholipid phosphatase